MDPSSDLDRYRIEVFGSDDPAGSGQPLYVRESPDAFLQLCSGLTFPIGLVRLTAALGREIDYPLGFTELTNGGSVFYDGSLLIITTPTPEKLISTLNLVLRWKTETAESGRTTLDGPSTPNEK